MLIENDVLSGTPLNQKVRRDILRGIFDFSNKVCFSHVELIYVFQNGAFKIL
jgi:hypothetical protein